MACSVLSIILDSWNIRYLMKLQYMEHYHQWYMQNINLHIYYAVISKDTVNLFSKHRVSSMRHLCSLQF